MPDAAAHLLIVDDDQRVRAMLARYLVDQGFHVSEAGDGAAMRARMGGDVADLVLLDLNLPGEDGFTLARQLRAAHPGITIIMITGRDHIIDRVTGLEVGADDYIIKPFHLREVLARIRSVLRRRHASAPEAVRHPRDEVFRFERWSIEPATRRVTGPDGQELMLTKCEFDLLFAFVTHASRVLERDQIMDLVKGPEWIANDRSIDQQVARLRHKIEPDPARPVLIKSVHGVGYCFAAKVQRSLSRDNFRVTTSSAAAPDPVGQRLALRGTTITKQG